MGNKCSCGKKPPKRGIKLPGADGKDNEEAGEVEMHQMDGDGDEKGKESTDGKVIAKSQGNDDIAYDDDDEDHKEEERKKSANALSLLKSWFRSFDEETDTDRRGVQSWSRNCLWRYFWDFILQKKFNDQLNDINIWGRELPSIYDRLQNIRRLAEYTLKRMDRKNKEKVFLQLTQFSDLQGPDVYWDEDLRLDGIDRIANDEGESFDDLKVLQNHFGTLAIDLFPENNLPVRGRWIGMNFTGNIDNIDVSKQESSDFVILTLSKEGWEDLKLITQANSHPHVRRIRAARQKIRMLHGASVTVVMKNCLRCSAPMMENVSQCNVIGTLQFNNHILTHSASEIIDYSSSFTFKLVSIEPNKIQRCGRRCQGTVSSTIQELDPDQFFIGSVLNTDIPHGSIALWEAALRRRRTCGISFQFYSKVYASKDLPSGDVESWRTTVQMTEGGRSDLYTQLFENQPDVTKLVHELHRRLNFVCSQPERAYWFKFWVTAIKAVFPSGPIPDDKWDFDFVVNHKAICYSIMERETVDELIKKSKIFDNATLYLSKNHSISKVLDQLYQNMVKLKNSRFHENNLDDDLVNEMPTNTQPTTTQQTNATPTIENNSTNNNPSLMNSNNNGNNSKMDITPEMANMLLSQMNNGNGGRPTTAIYVGGKQENSQEYNEMARQSQEVMSALVQIQGEVTAGHKTKEQARIDMAALALQYPLLLNAIGGTNAIEALNRSGSRGSSGSYGKKKSSSSRSKKRRGKKHQEDSEDSTDDSSSEEEKSGGGSKRSSRKGSKYAEDSSDDSGDDLKNDNYFEDVNKKSRKDKKESMNRTQMNPGGLKNRLCSTLQANGVNVDSNAPGKGEPDACTIM